jgi:hypothetical protein
MRLARAVFTFAGVWGFLVLTPFYFSFDAIGRLYPPPITHADLFYGFLAVTVAWQVAFLIIGSDPARFRPLMIPAMVEKFLYVTSLAVLWLQGRLRTTEFAITFPDCVLGILFALAFVRVGRSRSGDAVIRRH